MRVVVLVFFFSHILFAKDPEVLYLTWQDDPTTTIEVFWQVKGDKGPEQIHYRLLGEENWLVQKAVKQRLFQSEIWVYRASLVDLEPDSLYQLRLEEKIRQFHTLSQRLNRPLRVVAGGDAFYGSGRSFQVMNRRAAILDPDFVIMGGDIAYTEGWKKAKETHVAADRWYEFFRIWTKQMTTPNGRMIPIVPVIGNHDVRNTKQREGFYQVFAFREQLSYRVFAVGEIVFFLLDTGHTYSVKGKQTQWLRRVLQEHEQAAYKIPVYHVAAYPSYYPFEKKVSREVRENWIPLFEMFGVKIVLENHDHAFKRTLPMKAEKEDPDGIVFLGDGSWGVAPRKPLPHTYLAKALQSNCIWLLTFTKEGCVCQAFNQRAKLIDELTISEAAVSSVR